MSGVLPDASFGTVNEEDPLTPMPKRPHGADLYVIQSARTGAFKVGRSSAPERRLKQLQTGSPYLLKLVLVVPNMGHREKEIHGYLKGYEGGGGDEWFVEKGMSNIGDDLYDLLDPTVFDDWWRFTA